MPTDNRDDRYDKRAYEKLQKAEKLRKEEKGAEKEAEKLQKAGNVQSEKFQLQQNEHAFRLNMQRDKRDYDIQMQAYRQGFDNQQKIDNQQNHARMRTEQASKDFSNVLHQVLRVVGVGAMKNSGTCGWIIAAVLLLIIYYWPTDWKAYMCGMSNDLVSPWIERCSSIVYYSIIGSIIWWGGLSTVVCYLFRLCEYPMVYLLCLYLPNSAGCRPVPMFNQ
jgi:hypothetical protein